MKGPILFLVLVSILSGCATTNLHVRNPRMYWRETCNSNFILSLADRALCYATNPEYREDRKEAMPSPDKSDQAKDKEVDPRYKEMVP
jgi:hypothetical protein